MEVNERGRKAPIYIYFSVDTRTGDVRIVTFRSIAGGNANKYPKEVTFRTEQEYDLKEAIYKWLDEESKSK